MAGPDVLVLVHFQYCPSRNKSDQAPSDSCVVFFSGLVIIKASPLHFDIVIDLNVRATSPNVFKYAFSLNYLTLKRRRISIQTEKKEKEKKKKWAVLELKSSDSGGVGIL